MSNLSFEVEDESEQKSKQSSKRMSPKMSPKMLRKSNKDKEKVSDFNLFDVEEDNPLSDESGEKYIAQYNFTASTDLEQDDEPQLSLNQGDEVLVTDTTDPDWFTGRLISQDGSVGGKVGIFPAEYVRRSNDSEQMGSNGSREGSDLDDSTAAPAEIDAEDLIDEEGEGGGDDEEEEEDEDPQWKSHRIEKLRKAVRREHHGNIGILEARDLLMNSKWSVVAATALYKKRRAPKASDREFTVGDAKQCGGSLAAAMVVFAGLMAVLAHAPPAVL